MRFSTAVLTAIAVTLVAAAPVDIDTNANAADNVIDATTSNEEVAIPETTEIALDNAEQITDEQIPSDLGLVLGPETQIEGELPQEDGEEGYYVYIPDTENFANEEEAAQYYQKRSADPGWMWTRYGRFSPVKRDANAEAEAEAEANADPGWMWTRYGRFSPV